MWELSVSTDFETVICSISSLKVNASDQVVTLGMGKQCFGSEVAKVSVQLCFHFFFFSCPISNTRFSTIKLYRLCELVMGKSQDVVLRSI